MMILYFVGGSKGGGDTSFLSMALADFFTKYKNRKIIIVESDTSNPYVGKTFAHNDDVDTLSLSIDNAYGWIELVNSCEGRAIETSSSILLLGRAKLLKSSVGLLLAVWKSFICKSFPSGALTDRETVSN